MNEAALRGLVGIPYEFRGDGATLDCWQLVRRAARELFGLEYPDYEVARMRDVPDVVAEHLDEWAKVDAPEAGDVVLLTHHRMHCGIMLDRERFLHTLKGRNSAVERLDSLMWKHRVASFHRYAR